DCIFNAVLALLEFNLSSSANLEDCNAAGELSQALLQLLAVVVRVRVFDLSADLLDAAVDLLLGASTLNDGGLILGNNNLACLTQQWQVSGFQGQANFFRDDLAAGQEIGRASCR